MTPSQTTQTLIDLLIQRDQAGLEKYGTTLDRTDLTPEEWGNHMLQELLDAAGYLIREMQTAKQLREENEALKAWKSEQMKVESEWKPNGIATMLGGRLGESQRAVIQREVPRLLEKVKRLREENEALRVAGDAVESDKQCLIAILKDMGAGGTMGNASTEQWHKAKGTQ